MSSRSLFNKPPKKAATGFKKDPSFNYCTREQLSQLSRQGLQFLLHDSSSVDEGISQTASKEPQPHLVCFPWAIFEAHGWHRIFECLGKDDVSATASIALSMFEKLAKFADEKHESQHISPVIAITVAGANTTVWLAYCDIVDNKLQDHVRALTCSRGKSTDRFIENDQYMEGQYHQDLGCYSILPHRRQPFLLGPALP